MATNKEQCFEQLLLGKAVKSDAWLEAMRIAALARAETLNFPSERHDDWRFTDLSPLFQHRFKPVTYFARLTLGDIEKFFIPGSIRLVFVDGSYSAEMSDVSLTESSITVASLAECHGDQSVEENFGQQAPYQKDTFVALNTNFFEDGAWVHISKEVATPIHLLHVSTKRDAPSAIYSRNMVVLESLGSAAVIEDYIGLQDGIYFTNTVTEVVLKQGAQLQHVRVQREAKSAFHIGHCSVQVARNSTYTATSVALGARISRHTLHVAQQTEGAEIYLNGLTLIAGRQIADTHTLIDHEAPRGKSVQLHKCIADGVAHAVFSGKIMVHAGASGTDSEQNSRNMLLSDKARIDTQPQLEIFNDDVKCKHGATVGQIDADALFFLKSRGFSEQRARNLLTHAFAAEIIAKIPVPSLVATLNKIMLDRVDGSRT